MRITCPCCGERSVDEFTYQGDATVTRPDYLAPNAMDDFVKYVYERTNAPGMHRELWFHAAGCHAWLVVTRNIANHLITSVEFAKDAVKKRDVVKEEAV